MADRAPDAPRRSDQTRSILLGALVVVAILLALLNLDKIELDLIFGSPRIPLIILILACLAGGAAIDRLYLHRRERRRR
jgi:uncharacterized integral membrane protein